MGKAKTLLGGAVLFLAVAPGSLAILKAMNNGVGIELPYVAWVVLYFVYALLIIAG